MARFLVEYLEVIALKQDTGPKGLVVFDESRVICGERFDLGIGR